MKFIHAFIAGVFCIAISGSALASQLDPIANCQDVTIELDSAGSYILDPSEVDDNSVFTDGFGSWEVSPDTFSCDDIGTPVEVTLTVYDSNGDSDSCTSIVTVEDNEGPSAECKDITIQLDSSGNTTIAPDDIDNGSDDNCGIAAREASQVDFDCDDLGENIITLTVYDSSSNSASCQATVTVEDTTPPDAQCQNIIVTLDSSGNVSITGDDVDNGSSDACGMDTLSVDPSSFDCDDLGDNSVTLTATDDSGNSSTCTATVTVEDEEAPLASCQDASVQLDANGAAIVSENYVDNGSSDNCGALAFELSQTIFSCADVGPVPVTMTVYDSSSNSASCGATITVEDVTPPNAQCQTYTVYLDAGGNASITGSDIDNGSSDACGIASYDASPNSFTCTDVGDNSVTLTVTDNSGNSSTCSTTVTVVDDIQPDAVCQDMTVYLDSSGNASITGSDIDNGSTDACGISTYDASPNTFTCADVGPVSVSLTVTDVNGNSSTCGSTVTMVDNIQPSVSCQDYTVYLDSSGNATISGTDVDNGSSDACGISTYDVSPNSFTCADLGTVSVTLTVTDVNGNSATCGATVTVVDNTPPTASCQNFTAYLDASGNVTVNGSDVNNGSTDNCGGAPTFGGGPRADAVVIGLSVSPSEFTCANVGENPVTLTVTDASGNSSTCGATVTVVDDTPPNALCKDITVYLNSAGNASIAGTDVDNGSSDACGINTYEVSQDYFTCADIGGNPVTLTVTDFNGNSSTCDATVTVVDDTPPSASCQNYTAYLDADGNVTINGTDVDNGSSDNCEISAYDVSPNSFTCANIGGNPVTLTVTDVNGNSSPCDATVTVADNTPPSVTCQNYTAYLDGSGNVTINGTDVNDGSSDACGISSYDVSPNSFTCADVGDNAVTLTVTDVNGNSATCSATVTVVDSTPPVAVCQDISAYLDSGGFATITGLDVDNGSSDNCGISDYDVTPNSFSCAEIGGNSVTLTVTDNNGNTATCSAIVTVVDDTFPDVVCQDIQVSLDANGNASIVGTDVDNGSSDNCSISTYDVTPNSFTCANVGPNTVTLTVADGNGNDDSCTATVTVVDDTPPAVLCRSFILDLDSSGNASITSVDIDDGSTDVCGISTYDVSPNAFTCSDVGENIVTSTVTDVNGNIATCVSTVTVRDVTAPIAVCQDITVDLDSSGNATITAAQVDNGSSDECGFIAPFAGPRASGSTGSGLFVSPSTFTCADVGLAVPVTLTAIDASGNSASCVANVTVQDVTPPNAVCRDIVVDLDASGNATITAAQVNNGSSDECGLGAPLAVSGRPGTELAYGLVVTPDTFTCADIGDAPVTLYAYDIGGNYDSCGATVTIRDVTPPSITDCAPPQSATADGFGQAPVPNFTTNVTATDACTPSPTITQVPTAGTVVGTGTTNVMIYVADGHGNTNSCTVAFTVTAGDPPFVAPDTQNVVQNEGSVANQTGAFSDAEGNETVSLSASIGTLTTNVGAGTWSWSFQTTDGPDESQVVTITADDGTNPAVTTNFDLTVNNVPPSIVAIPDSTLLSADENRTALFSDPGADVWSATVTFGDGSPIVIPPVDQTLQQLTYCHVYVQRGTFTVSVVVNDGDIGGVDTELYDLTVNGLTTNFGVPINWLTGYGLSGVDDEAAVLADQDNDEVPTWQEYLAGSSPIDAASVFQVSPWTPVFGTNYYEAVVTNELFELETQRVYNVKGHAISWSSASDRLYDIEKLTNLMSGAWVKIATNVAATPALNTHTVLIEQASVTNARFRVRATISCTPVPP